MAKWAKNAVIYQIYPQSFCDTNGDGVGDINGIVSKLDYLADLGVDGIWICPMYDSPNKDNGYDVRNYEVLQERYGTMEDFDNLIRTAHSKNIKIIMDLVLNHTSNENPWFVESASSKDNPKADWYIWRDPKEDGSAPTNWGAIFGGSAWTYCPKRNQYYLNTFSPYQPDLNWENESLRKGIFEMVNRWLARGVDGFRLDAINFIAKDLTPLRDGKTLANGYADIYPFVANKPDVHKFLKMLKENSFDKYNCMTVGEASSATVKDALSFSEEMDMIFQFEHIALDVTDEWKTRPTSIVALKKCLAKWQKGLFGKAWNAIFWENHDQPRIVTRLGDEGEYRERSAKMLATCMYFLQGTPFIYQGQELGCVNTRFLTRSEVRDIEVCNAMKTYVDEKGFDEKEMLRRISRRSRDTGRTPMLWDDSLDAGFSSVTPWIKVNERYTEINAKEEIKREDSCFNFYKKLIALRKKLTVVQEGKFALSDRFNKNVMAYSRTTKEGKIAVICNMTDSSLRYWLWLPRKAKVLLSNVESSEYLSRRILAPYEAIVIEF